MTHNRCCYDNGAADGGDGDDGGGGLSWWWLPGSNGSFSSHSVFWGTWSFLWLGSFCCSYSVSKSCPTLCNPMDCSPPGSSVHGISQAKILEWVAVFFSRGSSRTRAWTCVSYIVGGFFTTESSGTVEFWDSEAGGGFPPVFYMWCLSTFELIFYPPFQHPSDGAFSYSWPWCQSRGFFLSSSFLTWKIELIMTRYQDCYWGQRSCMSKLRQEGNNCFPFSFLFLFPGSCLFHLLMGLFIFR